MENSKKRKIGESCFQSQSTQDIRSLVECVPKPRLVDLLSKLGSQHPFIAQEIRNIATPYAETVHRKIFVSSLSQETNSKALHDKFREYGEIENAIVVPDKVTGKSAGYGFVTFKDIESVNKALKETIKTLDGMAISCRLPNRSLRNKTSSSDPDLSLRKLYIGNLPLVTNEKLHDDFRMHGEIEEAVAYNKNSNVPYPNGYGFVTYKTVEAAKKAIDYYSTQMGKMIVQYADSQNRPAFPTGYMQPENSNVNYGAPNEHRYSQTGAVPYAELSYQTQDYGAPNDYRYPQTAAVPYAASSYQTHGQVPYPPQSRPAFPTGYVQPENARVNYGAPTDYRYPQSAAVPYAAPSYQTHDGQVPDPPHVSAMTNQFGQQYYYNYPNP